MTIRVTTPLLPLGMGIFGRKKAIGSSITRTSCVSGSAVTALQFLNGVSLSGEFSEEEIFKVWSVIYASAIRCLQSDEDKRFLIDFLRAQIHSPLLNSAFEAAAQNPQEVLYIRLEGPGQNNVSVIAKDLAQNVTNIALANPRIAKKESIGELAIPVFEHHVKEHFPEMGRIEQLLVAVLAGSFSVNVEDICRGMDLYGFEGTNLRITVAQTIYAMAPILYLLRHINE
jgi:hypothetical protein